ncbi:MAG: hypothetical protein PHC61_19360, partial [Chitinivibrionales bacterium]|nr:hypothetical protein [Chitinivibrionales bacterium]
MNYRNLFYLVKPLIPRRVQLLLRRRMAKKKLRRFAAIWPIDREAGTRPAGFKGWPENKRFALVLTHDVDTQIGHDRCCQLMNLEKELGFISSFNFVPERYRVSPFLRKFLAERGFEIGVHGLHHDGKLFKSRAIWGDGAEKINGYLKEWQAVGFRAPSMIRNLEWISELSISYDASTFDTDPFEPQPSGVRTIFPFWYAPRSGRAGYCELPYTLCQDFTLFVLLGQNSIALWKEKLDWIARNGGMALVNVHPDYINFFSSRNGMQEYSAGLYREFLEYLRTAYSGQYWHALPRDMADFW